MNIDANQLNNEWNQIQSNLGFNTPVKVDSSLTEFRKLFYDENIHPWRVWNNNKEVGHIALAASKWSVSQGGRIEIRFDKNDKSWFFLMRPAFWHKYKDLDKTSS